LTITAFYYKEGQTVGSLRGLYGQDEANSDAYGLNANYQLGDAYNTVLEGYLFSRISGKGIAAEGPVSVTTPTVTTAGAYGNGTADKNDTLYVPGLRASTNPIKGWNIQGEFAWQLGNHPVTATNGVEEAEHRNAFAAQFLTSYTLPVLEKYKPTVNASFTYVSGDKNGAANYGTGAGQDTAKSAKVDTAWDEFDKNQNGGTIYNSIFPLSNLYIYTLGASASPLEDVTASFTWSDLFAADKFSAENPLFLLQPNSNNLVAVPSTKNSALGLGNEYDINLGYNYTEDVSFGVSLGWFVPGSAFAAVNRSTASQAIADVRVAF
jgi:hypothetical protein